ncbi:MAG: amidophosphoribosyltransferase [Oscillospiraceae bacterium]|jgi:amidophosphoribosyltransferase
MKLHEECGIFGMRSESGANVASAAYYGLFALQHRGEESCGIAVNNDGIIACHKDAGQVNDVFTQSVLDDLPGEMAVGHVRYGADVDSRLNAQPVVVRHIKGGMALCNNGSLTNAAQLREELELHGSVFHSTSDAELIAQIITRERLRAGSIEEAVSKTMECLEGAYSIVLMTATKLIAVRDPRGFHPICMGELDGDVVFASETCALDSIGARFVRDVLPGEIVVVNERGIRSVQDHCGKLPRSLCAFEYIYFARPDSVLDGCSVHMARQRAGAFLAKAHPVDADLVVGVPDSGIDAAIGYSRQSGIPYGLGFIKNKYIGRTFIQPGQSQRENLVQIKLNAVGTAIKGKRIVLIDDSIVRGTTIARIVKLLREVGAKEIHMRSSAPPFLYPCYFGTDIDSPERLIANQYPLEEIAKVIGVDSLGYLSTEDVMKIAPEAGEGFCTACFTGEYPCDPPEERKKPIYMVKLSERKGKGNEKSK